jgi:transcriptional regulator with XRE-family HTH domain
MTLGSKLAKLRKENNYTQEQLADVLGVSRQAISKWESNAAYPETDKLIRICRLFHCKTDYLLLNEDEVSMDTEQSDVVHQTLPTNPILIESPFAKNLVSCIKVTVSPIFSPTKKQPKYLLLGVDKITIFGEHTTQLGWYKTEEDIQKEILEITDAIREGKSIYTLKYDVDVNLIGNIKDITEERLNTSLQRQDKAAE